MRVRTAESNEPAQEEIEALTELRCPLSYSGYDELDEDDEIVLGNDGQVYSRKAIHQHLTHDSRSPFTRQPLRLKKLELDIHIKLEKIIAEYNQKMREWNARLKRVEEKLTITETALFASEREYQAIEEAFRKAQESFQKPPELKEEALPPRISLKQSYNNQCFLKAVEEGNVNKARYYGRNGAYVDARHPDTGETALHSAILLLSIKPEPAKEMIRMLCDELHIDIHIKNFGGYTALHRAAARNDLWLTEYLLSKGADPLLTNDLGNTPHQSGVHANKEKFNIVIDKLLKLHESKHRPLSSSGFFRSVQETKDPIASLSSRRLETSATV